MNKNEVNSRMSLRLFIASLVLLSPLALVATSLSPNEYAEQGIEGVADCNGPLAVAMWAIPSCLAYGVSAAWAGVLAVRRTNWLYGILALLCVSVAALIVSNFMNAYREHSSLVHKEMCGDGW